MAFATILIRVLVFLFFLGLSGSAIVVLISFVEDGKELFGKEDTHSAMADQAHSTPS